MSNQKVKKPNPIEELKSVKMVTKLPIVESTYNYASSFYTKVKNVNVVSRWGLSSVEQGVVVVVDASLMFVPLVRTPLNILDSILYKGLQQIEHTLPAITYPPELLVSMTKDYFSSRVIRPVLRRADSVKQLGMTGATKYGDLAAERLDNALNIADRYVDKYLPPDSTDSSIKEEGRTVDGMTSENKRAKTIEHVNRLSRKLQRRLTKRTIAEAKALKQQSIHTIHCLLYLADLMVRDPVLFVSKMKTVWIKLSEDEPENQVPPQNLEQLISIIIRETSRNVVHLTNFTIRQASNLPAIIINTVHYGIHAAELSIEFILKMLGVERLTGYVVATTTAQLNHIKLTLLQLHKLFLQVMDWIHSELVYDNDKKQTMNKPGVIPLPAPPPAGVHHNMNNENNTQTPNTQQSNYNNQNKPPVNNINSNDTNQY